MDWKQIGAKWDLFKGSVRQEWGELTNDDLDYIAGTRDKLVGRLQEKYRVSRQEAEHQADRWLATHKNPAA